MEFPISHLILLPHSEMRYLKNYLIYQEESENINFYGYIIITILCFSYIYDKII